MIVEILEHPYTQGLKELEIEAMLVYFLSIDGLQMTTFQLFGKESFVVVPDAASIVKVAKREGAVGVVLVHNHPVRLPESFGKRATDENIKSVYSVVPSRDDIISAKGVSRELHNAGIDLVDDIIVAGPLYYSLREHGFFSDNGRFGVYDYRVLEWRGELYMFRLYQPAGFVLNKLVRCQDRKAAQVVVNYIGVPEEELYGFKRVIGHKY